MKKHFRFALWSIAFLFAFALSGCPEGCAPPVTEPDAEKDGWVEVSTNGNVLSFSVAELKEPLSAIQVPVTLTGGEAIRATAAGRVDFNLVQAGLNDDALSEFVLVVSDTRNLQIEEGIFAEVELNAAAIVQLGTSLGVTSAGDSLMLEVRP